MKYLSGCFVDELFTGKGRGIVAEGAPLKAKFSREAEAFFESGFSRFFTSTHSLHGYSPRRQLPA